MPYIRATILSVFASSVFVCASLSAPLIIENSDNVIGLGVFAATLLIATLLYAKLAGFIERRGHDGILKSSAALQDWARSASPATLHLAVASIAGLSLFLELVLIRWQASLFPVFALYKNFTLLACFCGLGIGYASSRKNPMLMSASLPMLATTVLLLTLLRFATPDSMLAFFNVVPVQEETTLAGHTILANEGEAGWTTRILFFVPIYFLLIEAFLLNALILIPVGQFCGYLMGQDKPLASYGYNLIGSILGVVLFFACGWLWIGPVIWFGLAVIAMLWIQLPSPATKKVALCSAGICLVTIGWPVNPTVQDIYSPYQLIQKGTTPRGLMQILASGSYYQKIYDLSRANANREIDPELNGIIGYYELPFQAADKLHRVAIVGAGSGNDVAAALRVGAEHIDAVEIDPAIRALGLENHPERPYQDPRVRSIIDDARTFFRNSGDRYDLIAYGVLDSHILLSHGSNVRLDSFVYTREGLQEAFDRLDSGGLMSIAFALPTPTMGDKVFRILRNLSGAGAPAAVLTGYDSDDTTTFLVKKGGDIVLPKAFLSRHGLMEVTDRYLEHLGISLELPSDDWPFFYMEKKTFPTSYVVSLGIILTLSLVLVRQFLPVQKWQPSLLPFFFLGSGFMLIETKAITELGLMFGNTWHVVGITIVSVLMMAYGANKIAARVSGRASILAYAMLLTTVALGYLIAVSGGIQTSDSSSKVLMVVLLTGPLLFSGVVFSTLLRQVTNVGDAMGYNLLGAMFGGALEYNSMQFGFASLYLIGLALYSVAWGFSRSGRLGELTR